jgi:DNA polymerase I-like protein with 3'-5' exonuclease and polymerase domains
MFTYPDPPFEPTKEALVTSAGEEWKARVGFHKEIRDGVKNTRYTMQYAKQAHTVARYAVKLGLPAKTLIEFGHRYLRSKPWLVQWKSQRWAEAWRRKEARTAFGRRRRLLGDRYQIEKEGLNHEVQGTVADMMKMTMVSLNMIDCRMVLQRHDGWYSEVQEGWDRMSEYQAVVEREWIIDGRPFTCPAEYETING